MGWDALLALAEDITQTYDGLFIGSMPDAPPPLVRADGRAVEGARITLEAFDSSYSLVTTDDAGVLARIRGRFADVEEWEGRTLRPLIYPGLSRRPEPGFPDSGANS
jgi:hypothetical protein